MNYLKVGCNFTLEFVDMLHKLNDIGLNKINEVYGSVNEMSFLTARPAFRLPEFDYKSFENYITHLRSIDIDFNYTLNANYVGDSIFISKNKKVIQRFIEYLSDIGIKTITVSIPIMAEFVREVSSEIGLEISTIAHIDTVTQIKLWKERYNITKVCGNLLKNRDISFLKGASKYCLQNDIIYTLIANEFCGLGSTNNISATHCIYRDHCYTLHSTDYNPNKVSLNDGYPMSRCISSRSTENIWLKMNFIRPEDMQLYNTIGIDNFKITGRTGTIKYLGKVIEAYVKGSWDGNLLELWKHLETIGKNDDYLFKHICFLDNKNLDGFLEFWFNNPSHKCSDQLCGVSCTYCDDYARKMAMMNNA